MRWTDAVLNANPADVLTWLRNGLELPEERRLRLFCCAGPGLTAGGVWC
jgi:hypothetical protein